MLEKDQVREHLNRVDMDIPYGMDPQELRKLACVVARSFLVFFESSWQWGIYRPRGLEECKCHPYLQKGKTEDLGNHRLFGLSLIRELNAERNF